MYRSECAARLSRLRFGARRSKVNIDAWDEVRVALNEPWDWVHDWVTTQGYPEPPIWLVRFALRESIRKINEMSTHGMRKRTEA